MKKSLLFLLATALSVAVSVPAASAAQSRTRARTGTYQDSKGNSGTFNTSTTRGGGAKQTDTSWTNQNGQTGSRTSNATWNKATQSGAFSSSSTLPGGKTASSQGTVTETAPGNYQIAGTHTGVNGQTSSFNLDRTKTETGSSTTGTITGPKGGVSTVNSNVTRSAGETVKTTDVTGPKGRTDERVVDTKFNPDGSGTRTIENTRPDGTTYTRTVDFSAPTPPPAPIKG